MAVVSHLFFFSSRRRHTRCLSDWSSDVCSSDLGNSLCHKGLQDRLAAWAIKPSASVRQIHHFTGRQNPRKPLFFTIFSQYFAQSQSPGVPSPQRWPHCEWPEARPFHSNAFIIPSRLPGFHLG